MSRPCLTASGPAINCPKIFTQLVPALPQPAPKSLSLCSWGLPHAHMIQLIFSVVNTTVGAKSQGFIGAESGRFKSNALDPSRTAAGPVQAFTGRLLALMPAMAAWAGGRGGGQCGTM